ncbi:MAG TPA: isochorismatase family protein [Thermoleophilaceae bacterium]
MTVEDSGMRAHLRARGLGAEIGPGRSPAVLVVDFVRGFTDPGQPLGSDLDTPIARTREVLDAARESEVPIIFTTVAYDDPDLADAGVWALKVPASASLRAGSPQVELDERLGRRPEESVIVKKYASAFFGTDLGTRLTSRGVDTIFLAGCTTSGCVRASAVDGLQHGFRVMVIEDAVGDRDPSAHAQSLFDMGLKYADLMTSEQAIEHLASARQTA